MAFPIKTCVACGEEFELKPDKPGFANRCWECSAPEKEGEAGGQRRDATEAQSEREMNESRRAAIREMLYSRK